MIEPFDHERPHDARDLVEIRDHSLRRARRLQRAADRDFETIRMAVEARALAGMVREHVCRFEAEVFADDHDRKSFAARRPLASGDVRRDRMVL